MAEGGEGGAERTPRRRQWFRWLPRVLGLLAAIMLGAWLLLPALIQWQIKSAIRAVGVQAVEVDVGQISHRGLTLSDIDLGQGQVRVPVLAVTYSLDSLRNLRIETITACDPVMHVGITDEGEIDLGPLQPLLTPGRDGGDSGRLPFDVLTVRDGELQLTFGGIELPVRWWGTLAAEGNGLRPDLHASIRGASLAGAGGSMRLLGVDARLQLTSFDPLTTAAAQTLSIADLRWGPWQLGRVAVTFALRGRELTVADLSVDSPQLGRLTVEPFTVDLAEPLLQLTLKLEGLDLEDTLAAAPPDLGMSGRGQISGTLRLRVKAFPPYRAIIDHGDLSASSGTIIRFASDQPLRRLINPTDEQQERLVRALQDFRYEMLDVRFEGSGEQAVARLTMRGRARGDNPTRIEPSLTLNVFGLNDLTNTAVADTAVRLPQWLERAMQRLAERSTIEGEGDQP